MKSKRKTRPIGGPPVALFTRAWIEIYMISDMGQWYEVALFTRAWIEIKILSHEAFKTCVALFTRAWIEIFPNANSLKK